MNNAWKRLLSAALAVILAVGLTRPAVAANDDAETTDPTTQSTQANPTVEAIEPADESLTQWTVQIHVFQNGDTTKEVYTESFPMPEDTVLKMEEININDYYSSRYGFKMDGWFNDGGWNEYKQGKNPEPLDEILIRGWTNLYCMVTDYNKVMVYGVTNGDQENAETVYDDEVLYGTNLVDYLDSNATDLESPGYTLDKWYNWDYYGHKFGDDKLVTGWTNVYVTYTANEYTLSFDANGGTVDPASQLVTYNEKVGPLPTPTKPGSTFAYWEDSSTGKKYTEDTVYQVADDTTLTAVWNVEDYTLTLDFGDKGDLEDQTITVHYGEEIGTLPIGLDYTYKYSPKSGYTYTYFVSGWVDDEGNLVTADTLYNKTENTTITAQYMPVPLTGGQDAKEMFTIQCTTNHDHKWVHNTHSMKLESLTWNADSKCWEATASFCNFTGVNSSVDNINFFGGQKHYWPDGGTLSYNSDDKIFVDLVYNAEVQGTTSAGTNYTGQWQPKGGAEAEANTVEVMCYAKPAKPDLTETKLGKLLWFRDYNSNNSWKPSESDIQKLYSDAFEVGDVYQEEDGKFYCKISVKSLDAFIAYFQSQYGNDGFSFQYLEELNDNKLTDLTYVLVYPVSSASNVDYKQDGSGWELDPTKSFVNGTEKNNGKTVYLIDRYVVTYTDGANQTVFKDEVHEIPLDDKGTATPAFADDYTRPGYTFEGWSPKISPTVEDSVTYVAQWEARVYTLTLDPNGGTLKNSTGVYTQEVTYGTPLWTSTLRPTRTGYTFGGWADESGEVVIGADSMLTKWTFEKNLRLHAVWTAKEYTVNFDANGGTVEPESKTVTYDSALGNLPEPTRTGYTFLGWFDKNGEEVTSETIFRNTATTTYTAHWQAKTYTVTFNPNGGEVDPDSIPVTYDSALGELPVPTKTGYTFLGWKDRNNVIVTENTVYQVDGNSTLTAVWEAKKYTLTLDFGGMGSFENKTITVTFGQPIGDLETGVETLFQVREDGEFRNYFIGGWEFEGGIAVTGDMLYNIDGDSVIYAQYIMAPDSSCTTDKLFTIQCTTCEDHVWVTNWFGDYVTLDKTSIAYDEENQCWTAQVKFTGSFLVNSGNTNDKYFDGFKHYYDDSTPVMTLYWDTESNLWLPVNGVVKEVFCHNAPAAPSTETIESLQKLIWVRDSNDTSNWYKPTGLVAGTYTVEDMYKENGKFYVDLTITDLTPYIEGFMDKIGGSGYVVYKDKTTAKFTFTLVYDDSVEPNELKDYEQDGTGWVVDQTKSGMTNTDMGNGKQLWVINRYVITYTDGVSNAVIFPDQVYDIPLDGTHNTPGYAGNPTRVGYTFEGWSPEVTHPVTQSVTYTAQWQAKTYTVYLDANGGEVSMDEMEVTYDGKLTGLPTPTRTGYTFGGWYDEDGKRYYSSTTYKVDGDITLTAKWTAKEYTVKFDANGGTVSPTSMKATYDTALGKLPVPKKTGYTFLGWYDENEQLVTSETIFRNTATTIYTAKWEIATYTLTLVIGDERTTREVTYGQPIGELSVGVDTLFQVYENGVFRNYFASGWEFEGGIAVTGDTIYNIDGDSVIYAQLIMAPDYSCTTNQLFTIQCTTCKDHVWVVDLSNHATLDKTSIAYDEVNQRWTAQVKFSNFSLVNLGNTNDNYFGGFKHYYESGTLVIDVYWDADATGLNSLDQQVTGLWLPVNEVVKEVYCYDKPAAPSTETVESLQKLIWIRDTNNTKNWYKPTGLVAGTYTVGDMYEENGKFYVDLTITDLTPYIQGFMDKIEDSDYVVDEDKTTAEFKFTLVYEMKSTGLKDYKQDGTGWVVDQTKSDMTNTDKDNGKQLWVAKTYTITLDAGEGSVDPKTVTVIYGKAVGTLPTPTRENYDFVGWYNGDEEVTADTVYSVAGDMTLTAKWEVSTHNKPTKKVTDSDVQNMQIRFYALGTEVINSNGEPFSISSKVGTNTTYEIGTVYGNDVEGYFVDVTFHFASGEKLESNARAALNRHPVMSDYPEWVGDWKYNFEDVPGYGADQTLTLEYNQNSKKWVVPGANNMGVAAGNVIHVYMDLEQYTVTYTDGVEDEEVFADTAILVGEGNTTPAFSGTTDRTGYTFQGWSPEVAETVTGNVTYTAQWTANTYTITLVNGEETSTMEVTYGQPIGQLPNLENAHSDFEGWFDEDGNQVTGDMIYTLADNMTLTAKWTGHVMNKVEAKEPTCTEAGNIAYWYCADCDKCYSDESCTVEITPESTVIEALGHHYEGGECTVCGEANPDAPVIVEGANGTWEADSQEGLTFVVDADIQDFVEVRVDGKVVDAKYYTVKAGSIIVTLQPEFLSTLGAGEHTLTVVTLTDSALCSFFVKEAQAPSETTVPTDPEGPDQTGETTNVALLVSLLVLSAACLAVVITKTRQWKVR